MERIKQKAVIIGSGFGGLSLAALLAHSGYQVDVLEKNESFGGRASVWKKDGFTFDMGPSWFLMPDVFDEFFLNFGKKTTDLMNLERLDPSYRIFFGKNDIKDISASLNQNKRLFSSLEEDGDKKFNQYLKKSENFYDAAKEILYQDFNTVFDFFRPSVMKNGRKLGLNSFRSMDKTVKKYFNSDQARKILEYSIVFLGGNPKKTPSFYMVMSHIDFNLGVWYPMGGIGKLTEAIHKIAVENGAKFHFNQEVKKIDVENHSATKVITSKDEFFADIVISNADYAFTEMKLLEEKDQSFSKNYWESRTVAPSAFIVYLGLNKKIANLKHHTLILDRDWQKHFDAIFEEKAWPESPSYYVCTPSKTDPSVAPEGRENLFILVPVAPDLTDTEEIRAEYYNKTLRHLESVIGESIEQNIVVKRIFAHKDFSERYNAYKGSALGLSHTLKQTAHMRPSHQSKKIKNLFYTGQYTHPGIGMPMTLISSQIVHDKIKKSFPLT